MGSLLDGGSSSTAAPAALTTIPAPAPAPGNAGQSNPFQQSDLQSSHNFSLQARELYQAYLAAKAALEEKTEALIDQGRDDKIEEFLSYLSQLNREMDDIDNKFSRK